MIHTKARQGFRRAKLAIGIVAVAVSALVLPACSGTGSTGTSTTKDTLTIALPFKPQNLNPGKNGNGGQNIVQWLAYEPLIRLNSDNSLSPGLATKWEYVGSGNMAFEMTIRTDATFADGQPVTAKSVVDTINFYLANPAALSHHLYGITGATVKDDQTVAIQLDKPNPALPQVFSQVANWGNVISPAGLAAPEKLTTEMFGAGPYTMDPAQTVDGDHYTFNKNDSYWNADSIHYNKVVVKVIADPNAAFQALQTGQIDVNMNGAGPLVDQAKASGFDIITGQGYTNAVFLMDRAGVTTKALGDVRVRQALNYAVDREAIAKALGGGYTPTSQIAPQNTDGFDPALDSAYSYDPEKAKKLLAEAGYPDGFAMDLLSTSITDLDTVSQAVADQFAAVGVTTKIKSTGVDLNMLIADMASKKFAAVSFNMGGAMFSNALQNFASPNSPLNPYQSTGDEVMAAFDNLAKASESDRKSAAVALNKTVGENAWFVPIAQTPVFVFSKGITNTGVLGEAGVLDVLNWAPAK